MLECPKCKNDAASLMDWGDPLFMFNPAKKCRSCYVDIELNINLFFSLCFLGALYSIIAVITSGYLAHLFYYEKWHSGVAIFILLFLSAGFMAFRVFAKKKNFRFFLLRINEN